MSEEYNQLKALFINDATLAIKKSQEIITSVSEFKTYEEFYAYHIKHPHISTCQKEWSTPQMAIKCNDCGLDPQSCICLECFLNGNHQGHDYIVRPNSAGNCDCGDLSLWKLSGCCQEHQGLNENDHPEDYLDEKLRNTLTDLVFKAAFAAFPRIQKQPEQKVSPIFQFLSSFLKFGDGFRRLIAISLTERIKFDILLSQVFDYKFFFNKLFQQLCGGLINDQLFKVNFALSNFNLLIKKTIPDIFTRFYTHESGSNYSMWNIFWFHSFTPQTIKTAIEKHNWDWVTFSLNYSEFMKNFFSLRKVVTHMTQIDGILPEISGNLYSAAVTQPNEPTQIFFDELFTSVLNCGTQKNQRNDTIISVSFFEMHDQSYYYPIQYFNSVYYSILNCFKLKKDLKFDRLIEELDKTIDISPIFCINHNAYGSENDLFVSKYVNVVNDLSTVFFDKDSSTVVSIEDHFKSFHNGGSFFFTMPLFDSLLYLFKMDNLCRVKISSLLSLAKFKRLRIQLGIVALKKLLALLCCHQSLVSKRNYAIHSVLLPILSLPSQIHRGVPLAFPLFQLLIGLQSEEDSQLNEFSLKEFFAFEMARELGLFDDYSDHEYKDEDIVEKQKSMFFTFLYLSILLNVERTLFNFNYYLFMEEQIISALKQGASTVDKLEKMCNIEEARMSKCHSYFNSIINKCAKSSSKGNSNDVSFTLKEGTAWKSISAIIQFNEQKNLLNKEILKNQNSLLKIQDFEDEIDYFFKPSKDVKLNPEEENVDSSGISIKLKEFLSTPTVLAVTYLALRMSGEKIDLNDHLAMNILILASKFAEDFDSPPIEPSTVIHYKSTRDELIAELKRVLFDYKKDSDGNVTITNRLNKANFKAFLNVKIGSDFHKPKSIVDILIGKGEIGKSVLQQLSIDVDFGNDQTDTDSIRERKKKRAKKLKESIINQYKTAISDYYSNELDTPEEGNVSNDDDVCSICASTIDNQILSYPLFIYRTKLPFIIDKPPLVRIEGGSELAADEDKLETTAASDKSSSFSNPFKLLFGAKKNEKEGQNKGQINCEQKAVMKRCTDGNNFVIQFSICQHPIHQSCVNQRYFKCPIDRSLKNGFLPCIDGFKPDFICPSEKVDEKTMNGPIKDSISGFIKNFTDFFDKTSKREANLFIELAKSIGGLISTFEIRLRNLPDCLDSNKNRILARNLFLTSWYAYRMSGKPDIEGRKARLTTFQRFILELIQSDDIEGVNKKKDAFQSILSAFVQQLKTQENTSINVNTNDNVNKNENICECVNECGCVGEVRREKEIFLFLRRAYLAAHFLFCDENELKNGQNKFIDWDDLLSVTNLSDEFHVSLNNLNDDFEFKPIVFAKLPKEFLRFALEPFNFPIVKTESFSVYNILDYNNLINDFDDFESSDSNSTRNEEEKLSREMTSFDHFNPGLLMKFRNKFYPTVSLLIGKDASSVLIFDGEKAASLRPFYVDNFGCPDIGFRRNKPLFLNEEKYGRVMDLILSGDFSFYINQE